VLRAAGDVNGDGIDDLAFGYRVRTNYDGVLGSGFYIYGAAGGPQGEIIDGRNVIVTSRIGGSLGVTVANGAVVGTGGDFTGNGVDDYVRYINGGSNSGSALLDGAGFALRLVKSDLNDDLDLGKRSIGLIGDIDGDGLDDLLISEEKQYGAYNASRAYVIFGFDISALSDGTVGTGADIVHGTPGADTLAGGGGADVLIGGSGNDRIEIADVAFARVDGGAGFDTLAVTGAGTTLALPGVSRHRLTEIEAIDLQGTGANTLVLDRAAVITASGTASAGRATLRIEAGADDTVLLADGSAWTVTDGTGGLAGYRIATSSTAQLAVSATASLVLNQAPVLVADSATISEDGTTVTGVVLGNDSDPDSGDTIALRGFGRVGGATLAPGATLTADYGQFVVAADGTFTYTLDRLRPAVQALGTGATLADTVQYVVSDRGGLRYTSSLSVTITGADEVPAISGLRLAGASDTGGVQGDGVTADRTPTIAFVVEGGTEVQISWGNEAGTVESFTVTGSGPQTVYRTLASGYVGSGIKQIEVTTSNGGGQTGTATLRLTVQADAAAAGTIDASRLGPALGMLIAADTHGDLLGSSVAWLDLNNDGLSDALVGAPGGAFVRVDDNYLNDGRLGAAFVVYGAGGGVGTLDSSAYGGATIVGGRQALDLTDLRSGQGAMFIGPYWGTGFGVSVQQAGDIDGDGIGDLFVSSTSTGYIWYGRADGNYGSADSQSSQQRWFRPGDATSPQAIEGFRVFGSSVNLSIGEAGDFNGDGLNDIAAALPNASGGRGEVSIVFGRTDRGFGSVFDTGFGQGRQLSLDNLGETAGLTLIGPSSLGAEPIAIDGRGDFNGDGLADLLIGLRGVDRPGLTNVGSAYIVFGDGSGTFGSLLGGRRVLSLDRLDPTAGVRLDGTQQGEDVGRTVAFVGDVNGDGYDDVLIAAPDRNSGSGEAYLLFGGPGRIVGSLATGDSVQSLTLANLSAADGVVIRNSGSAAQLGAALASAGDFNGDGYGDFVLGAPGAGRAYLFFGRGDSQLGTLVAGQRIIDLAALTPSEGLVFSGSATAQFGASVAGGGDANGDGLADLLIGAPAGTSNGTNSGDVYVVYGFDVADQVQTTASTGADRLLGSRGADVISGLGGADVIHAGAGNDLLTVSDDGFVLVDGGSGNDRLTVLGADRTLTVLSDAPDRLQGIEIIDLDAASTGSRLVLDSAGLMALSDDDAAAGGSRRLRVEGDATDSVLLIRDGDGSAWTAGASGVAGFDAWTKGRATVLVQSGVQVQQQLPVAIDQLRLDAASDTGFSAVDSVTADATPTIRFTATAGSTLWVDWSDGRGYVAAGTATGTEQSLTLDVAYGTVASHRIALRAESSGQTATSDLLLRYDPLGAVTLNLGRMETGQGFVIQPDVSTYYGSNGQFGRSLSFARDLNGDGYSDLLLAQYNDTHRIADSYYNIYVETSKAYGVYGNVQNLPVDSLGRPTYGVGYVDGGSGFSILPYGISGPSGPVGSGWSGISAQGDINGDGFADLIVGSAGLTATGPGSALPTLPSSTGVASIVFGRAGTAFGTLVGASTARAFTFGNVPEGQGFQVLSSTGSGVGGTVEVIRDLNGDGYDELLIGKRSIYGQSVEESYVLFGRPGTAWGTVASVTSGTVRILDVASLAPADGFVLQGTSSTQFASDLTSIGDLNGDGYGDFALRVAGTGSNGRVQILFGRGGTAFGAASGGRQVLDLTAVPASGGFALVGDASEPNLGVSVSGIGDFNGDGFDDFLVGATGLGNYDSGAGRAYIVLGRAGTAFGFSNGTSQELSVLNLGSNAGVVLVGATSASRLGFDVSGAGDFNGDGYSDLIVVAHGEQNNLGRAYVIFGRDLLNDPLGTVSGGRSLFNLANFDAADGVVLVGYDTQGAEPQRMRRVSAAGDVNADGFDDIFIASSYVNPFNTIVDDRGVGYVIYGFDPSGQATQTGTSGADRLIGSAGADTLSGLGGADVLRGGGGNDLLIFGDGSIGEVDGGTGIDSARLTGSGASLRLTAGAPDVFRYVERIDLTGSGNNSLTVDARTLLVTTDDVVNGARRLFIDGDAGDTVVVAGGGWAAGSAGSGDESGYTVYVNGLARLVVKDAVTVTTPPPLSVSGLRLTAATDTGFSSADNVTANPQPSIQFSTDAGAQIEIDWGDGNGYQLQAQSGTGALQVFDKPAGYGTTGSRTVQVRVGDGSTTAVQSLVVNVDPVASITVNLGNLVGADGLHLRGSQSSENLGQGAALIGDINGDGLADWAAGAPWFDATGRSNAGRVAVIFGGAAAGSVDSAGRAIFNAGSTTDGRGFILLGAAGATAGYSISSAGDYNGDGFDDFLIGAPLVTAGGLSRAGEAYLIFGRSGTAFGSLSGGVRTIDLASLSGTDGFVIQGSQLYEWLGASVVAAGDINGDGFDDLIAGTYYYGANNKAAYESGRAAIVFGRAGLTGLPDGSRRVLNLGSLTTTDGFLVKGGQEDSSAGRRNAGLGDFTGDGIDDFVVGQRGAPTYSGRGQAVVVFGRQGNFGSLAGGGRRELGAAALSPADGLIVQGASGSDYLGRAVYGAGDFNGDGLQDLIVGAPYVDRGTTGSVGETYIVFGRPGGQIGTLVGSAQILFTASLRPDQGFVFGGSPDGNGYYEFGYAISAAGDFNADGYDDLLVSMPYYDTAGSANRGAVYLLLGRADGAAGLGTLDAAGRRDVSLASFADGAGFIFLGASPNDELGEWAVHGGGDVNGDGYDDVIVGATRSDAGASDAGAAYVIYGRPTSGTPGGNGTLSQTIAVSPTVGAAAYAGAGDDVLQVANAQFRRIDGGSGLDTLRVTGDGVVLNLTALHGGSVRHVETIDLVAGSGANTLVIDAASLAAMTDDVTAGVSRLLVNGGAEDRVYLVGDWSDPVNGSGAEAGYAIVTQGNARLAVALGVTLVEGLPVVVSTPTLEAASDTGRSATDAVTADRTPTVSFSATTGAALRIDWGDGNGYVAVGTASGSAQSFTLGGSGYADIGGRSIRIEATLDGVSAERTLGLFTTDAEGAQALRVGQLTAAQGFVVSSGEGYSQQGYVGLLRDINGDGRGDFAVGAPYADTGGSNKGAVAVVFGGATASIDSAGRAVFAGGAIGAGQGFVIRGAQSSARLGFEIGSAGDVNADGYNDLLVSANGESRAYVLFGKAGSVFGTLSAGVYTVDLASLAPADGFRVTAPTSGIRIAGAGDWNADGIDDIAVGATGNNAVYVIYGRNGTSFGTLAGGIADVGASALVAADGLIVQGPAGANFGTVARAGDVNGDGIADLLIGAATASSNSGEAYVVFGRAGGPGTDSGSQRVVDVSALSAGDGIVIRGEAGGLGAGYSVASAGDINGDGYDDLLIGTDSQSGGRTYVVFGRAGGFGSLVGGRAVVDLGALGDGAGLVFAASGVAAKFGYDVSAAGDINGDGFDDLIVGSYGTETYVDPGKAYVVFGRAGFAGLGSVDGAGRRVLDVSNLPDGAVLPIHGAVIDDAFGGRVAGGVDVNGDGFDDVAIGAPYADTLSGYDGASYLIYGGSAGNTARTLSGDGGANQLIGGSAADTLTGGGGADVLRGGSGNDRLVVGDGSFLRIDGGSGSDTLVFSGVAFAADLTANGSRLSDVETIDLGIGNTGYGLAVSRGAVLSATGGATGATLTVLGDAADTFSLSGSGWTIAAGTGADAGYLIATQTNARVRVSADITLTAPTDDLITATEDGITVISGNLLTNDVGVDRITSAGGQAIAAGGSVNLTTAYGTLQVSANGNYTYTLTNGAVPIQLLASGQSLTEGIGYTAAAGSSAPSPASLVVRIEGSDEPSWFVAPSLASWSDTGTSASDRITADTTPTLLVRAPAGATIEIDWDGAGSGYGWGTPLTASGAEQAVTAPSLTGGSRTVWVRAVSGGVAAYGSLDLVIDGAASSGVIDVANLSRGLGFVLLNASFSSYGGSGRLGAGVAIVNDLNADGLDEVAAGAPGLSWSGADDGHAYLVYGRTAGPANVDGAGRAVFRVDSDIYNATPAPGLRLIGKVGTDGEFGTDLASAGDLNNDGIGDWIIGAPLDDTSGLNANGAAYVFYGRAGGLASNVDANNLTPDAGFRIVGDQTGDWLGWSVASAGDLNADGIDDLIIGSNFAAYSGDPAGNSGEAYVLFGRSDTLFGTLNGTSREVNITSLLPAAGFLIKGAAADSALGFAVTYADFNGDGVDDLLVGAYGAAGSGEAYVTFGKPGTAFGTLAASGRNVLDVAALGAGDGLIVRGAAANDLAGYSVASSGDFNGDGIADIAVGASAADRGGAADAGAVYVLFGRSSSSALGTLDGSGRRVVDLAGLDAADGLTLIGAQAGASTGGALARVGDFNGDGYDDLLIGAPGVTGAGGTAAGAAYLIFGRAAGGTVDLAALTAADGLVIRGNETGNDVLGGVVSGGGDINGDGYDDLVVSDDLADEAGTDNGAAYVIYGFDPDRENVTAGSTAADVLIGGSSADTLTGNGGADVLRGGAGNDVLVVGDGTATQLGQLFRRVDGGGGVDTLALRAGTITVDLTTLTEEEASSIERIDLTAAGSQTLVLDARSAAQLSERGAGGFAVLEVTGTSADVVTLLGSGWQASAAGDGLRLRSGGTQIDVSGGAAVQLPGVALGFSGLALAAGSDTGVGTNDGVTADTTPTLQFSVMGGTDVTVNWGNGTTQNFAVAGSGVQMLSVTPTTPYAAGNYTATVTVTQGAQTAGGNLSLAIETPLSASGLDLGSLGKSLGFVIQGTATSFTYLGVGVALAPDMTGDGLADVVVAAPGVNSGRGEAYVFFGVPDSLVTDSRGRFSITASTVRADDGAVIKGAHTQSNAWHLAVGDVNGDGLSDLLRGAPNADANNSRIDNGIAHIIWGQTGGAIGYVSGTQRVLDLSSYGGASAVGIYGRGSYEYLGHDVAVGDFNGDGYEDAAFAAPWSSQGSASGGATYIVFGTGSTYWPYNLSLDLASIGSTPVRVLYGPTSSLTGYWQSLENAGDLNADGIDDLVIGGEGERAYIVYGAAAIKPASGLAATTLSALTSQEGFVVSGDAAGDRFGRSAAGIGDINGDGIQDVIIGAENAPRGSTSGAGAAYVLFGRAGGWGSIDVSSAALGFTPEAGFVLQGEGGSTSANFARRVSPAGDFNGDGFDDFLIGAEFNDANGTDAGKVYLIYGKAGGFGTLDATTGRRVLDLANLTLADGFALRGDDANDRLTAVAGGGDINGDGYDDIVIGAEGSADSGSSSAGSAYVLLGFDTTGVRSTAGTTGADILLGSAGADRLAGRGGADSIRAGAGDDLIVMSDGNFRRIDGGTGRDTLLIEGGGVVLELRGTAPERLSELEIIDLNVGGSNTLLLSRAGVTAASGQRSGGTVILTIEGDAQDAVVLPDTSWTTTVGTGSDAGYRILSPGTGLQVRVATAVQVVSVGNDGLTAAEEGTPVLGNLLTNDSGVSAVTQVNGVTVAASGTTVVSTTYGQLTIAADGSYSFSVDNSKEAVQLLGAGATVQETLNYTATAGTALAQGQLAITVQGVNEPAWLAVPRLAPASDTGASSADGYTTDATPSVTVRSAAGATIDVDWDGAGAGGWTRVVDSASGADQSVAAPAAFTQGGARQIYVRSESGGSAAYYTLPWYLDLAVADGQVTASGLSAAVGLVVQGPVAGDTVWNVAGLGDVNGDGRDDYALTDGTGNGTAYVVYGGSSNFTVDAFGRAVINAASITADPALGYRIIGEAGGALGSAISAAGDINGDGIGDILVGAPVADVAGRTDSGAAYVIYGQAGSARGAVSVAALGSNGFAIGAEAAGDQLGYAVSAAGDVDGDGRDDLLVGAPNVTVGVSKAGAAYVLFGDGTVSGTLDLAGAPASTAVRLDNSANSGDAGAAVAGIGDINGDGRADFAVAQPGVIVRTAGGAYTVETTAYAWTDITTLPGYVQIPGLGDDNYQAVTLPFTFNFYGSAKTTAYITSNGIVGFNTGDLVSWTPTSLPTSSTPNDLIAALWRDNVDSGSISYYNDTANGRFIVQYKAISGYGGGPFAYQAILENDGDIVLQYNSISSLNSGVIGIESASGTTGLTLWQFGGVNTYPPTANAAYRIYQPPAGNPVVKDVVYVVLGDGSRPSLGALDLAAMGSAGTRLVGAANSKLGQSIAAAGDVDGDGYADYLVGAPGAGAGGQAYLLFGSGAGFAATIDVATMTAATGLRFSGAAAGDALGSAVSRAGDFNGDGFDDFLVAAPGFDGGGQADRGATYVIFGGGSRSSLGAIDLANLAPAQGFRIQGAASTDALGSAVSAAGDLNGDGFDDLIVSSKNADEGATNNGAAYVLFGFAANVSLSGAATPGADALVGTAGDDTLAGAGGADVLRGGAGNDVLAVSQTAGGGITLGIADPLLGNALNGFARIDGGAGSDTLRIDGGGLFLDFTQLTPERAASIERIDLTGSGDNTLRLALADVLDLSEARTSGGLTPLIVSGNAGDALQVADSGWTYSAGLNQTVDGETYYAYTNGSALLLVDPDLQRFGLPTPTP